MPASCSPGSSAESSRDSVSRARKSARTAPCIERGALRRCACAHAPVQTGLRGSLLLAGDAASLVNPLSGEGIYYALASGRLAARAALLAPEQPAAAYRRLLARALGRHLRHAAVLARAIRSPLLAEAGLGAAAASPALFDVLVELGLGQARITPRLLAALPAGLLRATRGTGSAPAGRTRWPSAPGR